MTFRQTPCKYRFECIATVGPTALHACPHCRALVPTGQDPRDFCMLPGSEAFHIGMVEYIDGQEVVTIERDITLEDMLNSQKKKS